MLQKTWLCALALAALAPLARAEGTRVFPTSPIPVPGDAYPDRITAFAGGVTGLADVVYATIPSYRPLILDLYLPKGEAAKRAARPLVIYIHGGGWMGGHTRQSGALSDFPAALAELAGEGFVVASVEYRLSGEARFPAALQDVRAAIRFLKANAGKYGIDPARVGLWGGSAGGHLTALAALSCGVASLDSAPAPAGSECVQAAVTWYGVFDFAPMAAAGAPPVNAFLGCGADKCAAYQIAAASPVTYITAKAPPMLLIHGEADKTVPVAQSHEAEDKLRAAGAPVQSLYIADVDHSFVGRTPEETHAATVKAMNATYDFFHAQLDGKAR